MGSGGRYPLDSTFYTITEALKMTDAELTEVAMVTVFAWRDLEPVRRLFEDSPISAEEIPALVKTCADLSSRFGLSIFEVARTIALARAPQQI